MLHAAGLPLEQMHLTCETHQQWRQDTADVPCNSSCCMLLHALPYIQHREAAACQVYDELLAAVPGSNGTSRRASSNNALPRPLTGPLPWLYYLPGSAYLTTSDVDIE